jgi:hypothetical protein
LLKAKLDQGTVHILDGRANLWIEGLDKSFKRRHLGRRYAWNLYCHG